MPVTQLKDEDVVNLLRKEYERKLKGVCDKHGISYLKDNEPEEKEEKSDSREKNEPSSPEELETDKIEPGLRIKHKDSGLEYYVVSINTVTGKISLENGSNQVFALDANEVESDYELS